MPTTATTPFLPPSLYLTTCPFRLLVTLFPHHPILQFSSSPITAPPPPPPHRFPLFLPARCIPLLPSPYPAATPRLLCRSSRPAKGFPPHPPPSAPICLPARLSGHDLPSLSALPLIEGNDDDASITSLSSSPLFFSPPLPSQRASYNESVSTAGRASGDGRGCGEGVWRGGVARGRVMRGSDGGACRLVRGGGGGVEGGYAGRREEAAARRGGSRGTEGSKGGGGGATAA